VIDNHNKFNYLKHNFKIEEHLQVQYNNLVVITKYNSINMQLDKYFLMKDYFNLKNQEKC
jgi:hypothetical protein